MTMSAVFRPLFTDRVNVLLASVAFLLTFLAYSLTLPAEFTDGRIGLVSLRALRPSLAIWATAFATEFALLVPLLVQLRRSRQRGHSGVAACGALTGLVVPLLCCSPIMPTLLGLTAGTFPVASSIVGLDTQEFLVTHEAAILAAGLALMAFAILRNARQVYAVTAFTMHNSGRDD